MIGIDAYSTGETLSAWPMLGYFPPLALLLPLPLCWEEFWSSSQDHWTMTSPSSLHLACHIYLFLGPISILHQPTPLCSWSYPSLIMGEADPPWSWSNQWLMSRFLHIKNFHTLCNITALSLVHHSKTACEHWWKQKNNVNVRLQHFLPHTH